jgi:hypothetical protein
MAKKWKAYPWPDRVGEPTIEVEEDEEIDVVGDSPANQKQTTTSTCWGPSSPTAGTTAPSPPPHSPEATKGSTILYNGECFFFYSYSANDILIQSHDDANRRCLNDVLNLLSFHFHQPLSLLIHE